MLSWPQLALDILSRHEAPYFYLDYSELGVNEALYFYGKLTGSEQSHAQSLRGGKDQFINTRGALRVILKNIFHADPIIEVDAHGKPFTKNIDCQFNVSHTDGAALIVLGGSVPVGADLELIKNMPDLVEASKIVFHESESADFESSGHQKEMFYRIWVRKEAVLKAVGLGIIDEPEAYFIKEQKSGCCFLYKKDMSLDIKLSILDLPIKDGYIGALAATKSSVNFRGVSIKNSADLIGSPCL